MSALDFVHLHVHSNYSLLEGAIPLARLADLAKADKQAALALTDTDNMFGALEFSEKMASAGIQPIVGCALAIDFGDTDHGARNANAAVPRERIVLLAARDAGYRSLMRLSSRAFLDTPPNEPPRLKLEWLEGETEGIIALTGGPGGPLDGAIAAGQSHLATTRLEALHRLFGDRLYVELQRHGTASERTDRAGADRSRLRQRPAAGRHQRALFRDRAGPRSPRRADLHRGRAAARRNRPPPAQCRAPLQEPRRNGRTVRRSAGGARQHRRDRRALRLPPA